MVLIQLCILYSIQKIGGDTPHFPSLSLPIDDLSDRLHLCELQAVLAEDYLHGFSHVFFVCAATEDGDVQARYAKVLSDEAVHDLLGRPFAISCDDLDGIAGE